MKVKRKFPNAHLPTRGSAEAAGWDLYAVEVATIPPHETVLVDTGIIVEIPQGYFGGLYARSGLALRQGLRPANCVGIIDSDYRDSIKVAIHNDSNVERVIAIGDRIAQLVVTPYYDDFLEEVEELTSTDRGQGGFGSTGK
jgi:dUTP pyrophosphatase